MSKADASEEMTEQVRLVELGIEFEVLRGDSIIGPAIRRGAWAADETRLLRAHLVPGCRVVDLGANVGWFSVQAIACGAEVDAFEPVPAIAAVCERNIARANALGRGFGRLHACAAGDAPGRSRIALARANRGDNRMLDREGAVPPDMEEPLVISIEVRTVDEIVDGPVRFMKIDTQGSEWLALQGAQRVLERSPNMALLMELWPYALRGGSPEQLLRFLVEQGFQLGKATAAPYPMSTDRILRQALAREPVRGGIDLYGTRGLPFHVGGFRTRMRSIYRSLKEA